MKSRLFHGIVEHHRRRPHGHRFRYAVRYLGIDLSETDTALDDGWLCSGRGPALVRFCRRDYFGTGSLATAVRRIVASDIGRECPGRIELVTTLRSAGMSFNPVSFYLCHDADDKPVALVAEITNTPWRERGIYTMPLDGPGPWRCDFAKRFHVSPFMGLEQDYHWTVTATERGIGIDMRVSEGDELVFSASLGLAARAWSRRGLRRHILASPVAPALTMFRIHLQALFLWWKKTPFHDHPRLRGDQRHRPLVGSLGRIAS
ncbi:MAG: DUF1365 domain-containing protein [Planctomycetota bacterium]|jgi:DUF1365 family protein|nr:DUF1365 domain-containing protein [Planctomycetota bacterium]